MSHQKMSKDIVPNDFTLGLAIVDAIPVVFFAGSMVLTSFLLNSKLFLFGSLLCLLAGIAKVLWKIIVVLKKKNIWFLFIQMRIIMPIGLVLMVISLFYVNVDLNTILSKAISIPMIIFFLLGIIGMILMAIFAFKLDSSNLKTNWLEQIINGIAQMSFFCGLLHMLII